MFSNAVRLISADDTQLASALADRAAALGATVTVPQPSGSVGLKIPANSAQGSKLRLKGKGLPGKAPGDLYVLIDVQLPPADSDAAKALYKKMSEELPFDPRADM